MSGSYPAEFSWADYQEIQAAFGQVSKLTEASRYLGKPVIAQPWRDKGGRINPFVLMYWFLKLSFYSSHTYVYTNILTYKIGMTRGQRRKGSWWHPIICRQSQYCLAGLLTLQSCTNKGPLIHPPTKSSPSNWQRERVQKRSKTELLTDWCKAAGHNSLTGATTCFRISLQLYFLPTS